MFIKCRSAVLHLIFSSDSGGFAESERNEVFRGDFSADIFISFNRGESLMIARKDKQRLVSCKSSDSFKITGCNRCPDISINALLFEKIEYFGFGTFFTVEKTQNEMPFG